jgi:hypothetical protein
MNECMGHVRRTGTQLLSLTPGAGQFPSSAASLAGDSRLRFQQVKKFRALAGTFKSGQINGDCRGSAKRHDPKQDEDNDPRCYEQGRGKKDRISVGEQRHEKPDHCECAASKDQNRERALPNVAEPEHRIYTEQDPRKNEERPENLLRTAE